MSYRSKRTLSVDGAEPSKRPTPAMVAATSSEHSGSSILEKESHGSPLMQSSTSTSKPAIKWGPFGPPIDSLNITTSTLGSSSSNLKSIWKTIPATATTKPAATATTKPAAKPATTKPTTTKPPATTTKPPAPTKPPDATSKFAATTKPPAATKPTDATSKSAIAKAPSITSNPLPPTKSPATKSNATTKPSVTIKPATTKPTDTTKLAATPLGTTKPPATTHVTTESSTANPLTTASNYVLSANETVIPRNGQPNQIRCSTKDFQPENTYEDLQKTVRDAQISGQQTCEQQTSGDVGNSMQRKRTKSVRKRLPFSVNGWPTDVEYDPKEEVATIDANGKVELVSGTILPVDVLSDKDRRYFVEFNELHQPIRKGGHVLVKFLGYIAKMGEFCPVGALTWYKVEQELKVKIIKKMREHFIIPNDHVYNTLALQRVDKYWRHYKHELKKTFFQPDKKTQEQHYEVKPNGISPNDWIKLVNYWFSPKGKKLSQIGKEARSLQCQTHILGGYSIANLRADYEDEHGKPMGLIEAWKRSHMRKDGTFVEGTMTKDFLNDAEAKKETLKLAAPSTCCEEDLEDEAFHAVMNGGKIPERPQGFGFGVKKSDVYGFRGLLRKEGYGKGKMKFVEVDLNSSSSPSNNKKDDLEKRNEELAMKYNENNNLLKTMVTQFSSILDAMRNGKASTQLLDAAQSTLVMATQQVHGSHNDAASCDGFRSS